MEEDIELEEASRFFGGELLIYADGTVDLQAQDYVRPDNFRFTLHTVVEGQTLDRIAFSKYGSQVENASRYWWLIAEANNIERPWDLSDLVGKEIVIPDFVQFQINR